MELELLFDNEYKCNGTHCSQIVIDNNNPSILQPFIDEYKTTHQTAGHHSKSAPHTSVILTSIASEQTGGSVLFPAARQASANGNESAAQPAQ